MTTTYVDDVKETVRYWWTYLIGGILLLVVGVLILVYPVTSYAGLSLYFAVAILVSGIMNTLFSISNRDTLSGWGWYLVGGIIDLIIGFYLLTYPLVAAATLPLYIGFWLMFRSFSGIGTAFDLRSMGMKGWGWLLVFALLTLALAIGILFNPALGVLTAVSFTSYAMLALGVLSIIVAFRLREVKSWYSTSKHRTA
jgi:uncharacterized membrane protein HdeD (DUF308 family)